MIVFADDDVCCPELSVYNYEVEEVINKNAENWNDMGELDRANLLRDNGVESEDAYETAVMDAEDVPPEWLEYFV